jgi:hypothetical protein
VGVGLAGFDTGVGVAGDGEVAVKRSNRSLAFLLTSSGDERKAIVPYDANAAATNIIGARSHLGAANATPKMPKAASHSEITSNLSWGDSCNILSHLGEAPLTPTHYPAHRGVPVKPPPGDSGQIQDQFDRTLILVTGWISKPFGLRDPRIIQGLAAGTVHSQGVLKPYQLSEFQKLAAEPGANEYITLTLESAIAFMDQGGTGTPAKIELRPALLK